MNLVGITWESLASISNVLSSMPCLSKLVVHGAANAEFAPWTIESQEHAAVLGNLLDLSGLHQLDLRNVTVALCERLGSSLIKSLALSDVSCPKDPMALSM